MIKQLWSLFIPRERWQVGFLFVALLVRAAVELVGVASILPFMSVVANPEVIRTNQYLAAAFDGFGFNSENSFLVALGLAVVLMLAFANTVSALVLYGTLRFSWGIHHRLSVRLLKGYLYQPYSFFLNANSAKLNTTLYSEVQAVVSSLLIPVIDVGARALTTAAIVTLLVLVDPWLALAVVALLGGIYGAIYVVIRGKQRRLGIQRVRSKEKLYKVSGEAFGGIKDVKVLQLEDAFLDRFRPVSRMFASTNASNAIISQLPRYVIETLAFGGIVLIVVYHIYTGQGLTRILPMVSLYAFAGYRMMPEIQKLFTDLSKIRFNRAALDQIVANYHYQAAESKAVGSSGRLPFEDNITVESLTFRYPGASVPVLDAVKLRIEHNNTIGLIGASGAGKTTLVDLLLGLYGPDAGRILVDGVPLDETTLGAWRRQVGYVPQHIFLMDDSIAANIAFGVRPQDIDMDRVVQAAHTAHLHEFIESLPSAYETVVGERGIRLSGGQRQRIGIARALYHDPQVLVMDEATSSLDGATENAVMEAINELSGKKTIILIAHRLTTVRACDVIYLLDRGKVRYSGTYEELLEKNQTFRAFAGVSD